MNRFTAETKSEAVVPAPRMEIWAALTDPVLLPKLTPLLKSIQTKGDEWRWYMVGISALGVTINPTFTERMRFNEGNRIDYSHEPPAGVVERTGAEGYYILTDVDGGTKLEISLTLLVELPLPKLAAGAVSKVIEETMRRTGDRFSANLLRHLGLNPSKESPSKESPSK